MAAASMAFLVRAGSLRSAMHVRSGIGEGLDIVIRLRKPVDPMELHDWLAKDFTPLNDAYARIQVSGTADAVEAASALIDACADVLGAAVQTGEGRGKVSTVIAGMAWSTEQETVYQDALAAAGAKRKAFIATVRM